MPTPSPEMDLLRRLHSFFQRYLTWLRQHLDELSSLEDTLHLETLDEFFALQERRNRELDQLLKERRGLLVEWEAEDSLSEDDRTGIRALAKEAAALTDMLSERYAAAAARSTALQATLQPEQQSLVQGRKMMHGYRPDMEQTRGFLDRNA